MLLAATENWHVCEASSARVLVGTRGRGDAPFPGGARARRCHARSCCTGTAWQQVRPTGGAEPGPAERSLWTRQGEPRDPSAGVPGSQGGLGAPAAEDHGEKVGDGGGGQHGAARPRVVRAREGSASDSVACLLSVESHGIRPHAPGWFPQPRVLTRTAGILGSLPSRGR